MEPLGGKSGCEGGGPVGLSTLYPVRPQGEGGRAPIREASPDAGSTGTSRDTEALLGPGTGKGRVPPTPLGPARPQPLGSAHPSCLQLARSPRPDPSGGPKNARKGVKAANRGSLFTGNS